MSCLFVLWWVDQNVLLCVVFLWMKFTSVCVSMCILCVMASGSQKSISGTSVSVYSPHQGSEPKTVPTQTSKKWKTKDASISGSGSKFGRFFSKQVVIIRGLMVTPLFGALVSVNIHSDTLTHALFEGFLILKPLSFFWLIFPCSLSSVYRLIDKWHHISKITVLSPRRFLSSHVYPCVLEWCKQKKKEDDNRVDCDAFRQLRPMVIISCGLSLLLGTQNDIGYIPPMFPLQLAR